MNFLQIFSECFQEADIRSYHKARDGHIFCQGMGLQVQILCADIFLLNYVHILRRWYQKFRNRQAEIQEKLDALDAWNLDANLELAMEALRCPPAEQVVDVLSGGERRRVALCRLLLQKPDQH